MSTSVQLVVFQMTLMMDPAFARTTYFLDELRLKYHKALSERQTIPITEWNLSNASLTRFGNGGQGTCSRHYFRERSGMQRNET